MYLLVVILVVLLLFGGGGYYGHTAGWHGPDLTYGLGSIGLILVLVLLVVLLR